MQSLQNFFYCRIFPALRVMLNDYECEVPSVISSSVACKPCQHFGYDVYNDASYDGVQIKHSILSFLLHIWLHCFLEYYKLDKKCCILRTHIPFMATVGSFPRLCVCTFFVGKGHECIHLSSLLPQYFGFRSLATVPRTRPPCWQCRSLDLDYAIMRLSHAALCCTWNSPNNCIH